MRHLRRGQTIALFALTVLLVALMVLMTLSIGAKVRDRMDLQTVADAAAYSNAIATARTMNTMAVFNRAMIAHTVSTIGAVSLISYATLYYTNAVAAANLFAYQLALVTIGYIVYTIACIVCWGSCVACSWATACLQSMFLIGASLILMTIHKNNTRDKLRGDDEVYNRETYPRFLASQSLHYSAIYQYDGRLRSQLGTNSFAVNGITTSKVGATASAQTTAGALNNLELTRAARLNEEHSGPQPYHAAQMAMGTRGHRFVTDREVDEWDWSIALTVPWSLPNGTWAGGNSEGKGYVNNGYHPNPSAPPLGHPGSGSMNGIWAHDRGNTVRTVLILNAIALPITAASATYVTCFGFGPAAVILGILGEDAEDTRVAQNIHLPGGIHGGLHTYPGETFPSFYDYNADSLVNGLQDLYGQPRTVSVVEKTPPPKTTNPWDMTFSLGLTGRSARFNMMKTNVRALAIGSGVTYYARPDHYREPPNMFAPYWHGTLTRLTVDRPAGIGGIYDGEIQQMLNATGQTEATAAYDGLSTEGYLGLR